MRRHKKGASWAGERKTSARPVLAAKNNAARATAHKEMRRQ